jgi:hypothetical protein
MRTTKPRTNEPEFLRPSVDYTKEIIDRYDCMFVDTTNLQEKPDLARLSTAGASSGLELDIKMQRASEKKAKGDANVLNTISRELLLAIEPLPQFAYCTDPGRETINAQILESFYQGSDRSGCTNPTGAAPEPPPGAKKPSKPRPKVPDPLYRAWGDAFYSAFPVTERQDTRSLHQTSCGLHCFTQVVRHLRKEGDQASVYDKMLAELRNKGADGAYLAANSKPVLFPKAPTFVPSTQTIIDEAKKNKVVPLWDPDVEPYFKFWYPAWVLWWCRWKSGQTFDTWPKEGEPLINSAGIFAWQAFIRYAEARDKDSEKANGSEKAKGAGKAKRTKKVETSGVPEVLAKLGLVMVENTRGGRVLEAVKEIVAALDEGYPVTILRKQPSGHFMLIVGYVQDAEGLRFIINDSGQHAIQRMINPFIPHTVAEPVAKGKEKDPDRTVTTLSRVVEKPEGEEEQTSKTVSQDQAKLELQKIGYHIVDYVEEIAEPPKKVTTGKGKNKIIKTVTTYLHKFTWDWRIASEWWNYYWILKWADGKQQKKVLSFKAAEFAPPEQVKEEVVPKVKALWFAAAESRWDPNTWEDVSLGPITVVAELEQPLPKDATVGKMEAEVASDSGKTARVKLAELHSNRQWLRGTLKAAEVDQALGLAAPRDSYVTCDFTEPSSPGGTVTGTFEDSAAFEQAMQGSGVTGKMLRGARNRGTPRSEDAKNDSDWAPASNFAFVKAGGAQCIRASVDGKRSPWRLLKYEASYFYHSGHGHHDSGALTLADGEQGPDSTGSSWWKMLKVCIVAGCSVLDAHDPTGPGRKWMSTGASLFLGYASRAPKDARDTLHPTEKGVSSRIIQAWVEGRSGGTDLAQLWCKVNLDAKATNACAIDLAANKYVWIDGWDFNPVIRAKVFVEIKEMAL